MIQIYNKGAYQMQLVEKRVKKRYLDIKEKRDKEGIEQKSIYEEAMSSYFYGNYRSAFIWAYVYLVTPIAINSKRLHKKKNEKKFREKKDPYKFNLTEALDECIFLTNDLKNELSKCYSVTLQFPQRKKEYNLSISQIRNITVHPEDDRHFFAVNQINYKEYALFLLDIAPRVYYQYNSYLKSPGKEKRKQKEIKVSKKLYAVS